MEKFSLESLGCGCRKTTLKGRGGVTTLGQGSPGQNSGIHEKYGSWYKNEHTIVHAWFCLMDHQRKIQKRTAFAFVWS